MFDSLVGLAAMTSCWSAVRWLDWNVGDLILVLAVIVALVRSANGLPLFAAMRIWMFMPAFIALLLLFRDVVVLGNPLNASADITGSGGGVSPLVIVVRVVLSTVVVAAVCSSAVGAGGDRAFRRVLGWWYLGAVLSAVVALLQAFGLWPEMLVLQQTLGLTPGAERQAGLGSHPNSLAQTLSLALPIGLAWIKGASRLRSLLLVASVVVMIAAILESGSRAGLLVGGFATMGVLVWLLAFSRYAKLIIPTLLVLVVIVITAGPSLIAQTRLAGDSSGAAQSDFGRINAISVGFEIAASSPIFGAGLGSWFGEFVPLILMSSGGVLLLGVYTWFIGGALSTLLRGRRTPLILACIVSTTAVVAFGLLNNGFLERYTFWPTLLAAAWVISESIRRAGGKSLSPS